MRYFLEVASHGGFHRAASHLNLAQSALSRQIQLLEHEMGTQLFIRSSSGVKLTEAGKMLRIRAEALLSQAKIIRDEVMSEGNVVRGNLVIGMPPSLNMRLSVPLLSRMRERYPDVFLNTRVATSIELRQMLLEGSVVMAVIGILDQEPILTTEHLFADQMYAIGRAGRFDRQVIDISEVARLPAVLTSAANSVRRLVDRAANLAGFSMNVIMEVNNVQVQFELIKRGLGITVLPGSALQGIDDPSFSWAPVDGLFYNWALATRRNVELTRAGKATYDAIRTMGPTLGGDGCMLAHATRSVLLSVSASAP